MRDLYVLYASTPDGSSVRTGPVTIAEAMRLVDEELVTHGWNHHYEQLTPVDEAVRIFHAGAREKLPGEEADFFIALRRAIITDPHRDGLEDEYVRGVLAHVDPHRPMQLYTADEEHLLGECDCPRVRGVCAGMEKAERICSACSAILDSNTEYGPWFALKVAWPCPVIAVAVTQYGLSVVTREEVR